MSIDIKEIPTQDVWLIKHRVMCPEQGFDYVKLPKDHEARHCSSERGRQLLF